MSSMSINGIKIIFLYVLVIIKFTQERDQWPSFLFIVTVELEKKF